MCAGKFSNATRKCTGARKYPAIHGVEIRIRAEESKSTGDANGDPHDFSVGFDREPVHFVPPKTRDRGRAGASPRVAAIWGTGASAGRREP